MPDVIKRLFTSFPIHIWPSARAVATEMEAEKTPSKPILYVATQWPGQWTSADPVSLRWQMELLLRDAEFDVVALDDAYWAPEGNTPFLHLSPEMQSTKGNSADLPELLACSRLPHFVENHYPLVRPELDEKSVWPSEEVQHESVAWHTLLYGRVTAGALLLALQSDVFAPRGASQPLLRSMLASWMPGEATAEQRELGRLLQLASAGGSYQSQKSVFGDHMLTDRRNPLALVPGYGVDFVGVLSGSSQHEAPDEEVVEPPLSTHIDQEAILEQATSALTACASRLETDLKQNQDSWMLGAQRPTSLDCLLFASLHTILSIPSDSPGAHSSLRMALDRHPVLMSYTERLRKRLPGRA